ncbi:MAG: SUMF1/EgtB/PvdO family nonheme iron enzyme [Candidatus Xenobiia bacterium LiM19]
MYCSGCGKQNRDTARFCHGCGAPLISAIQAGSTLDRGRYEVRKQLNKGGMGTVYLLKDHRLERECVLKEMVPPSQDPGEIKEFRERFRNEALTLSRLSHRNLPRVTDHFEENNQCFLVMDYIEGDDLESLLAKKALQGFPEKTVKAWALDILSVLEYLHGQNPCILYRDLKPSNIMVRRRDAVLFLVDFGLAKSVTSVLTHKTSWGTEGYAPIEQCQGEPEVRSDLYALGATMHHLLSGRPPVPFKFAPIRSLRPDVSPAMEAFLEKALKLHAHERYQTASEMREALERCSPSPSQGGSAAVSPSVPPSAAPPQALKKNQKDGADMVLVPAGEFLMGSLKGKGHDEECPQHRIYVDAYYIYMYPVTNRQFEKFTSTTGYRAEGDWKKCSKPGKELHPVVRVTWNDAEAYCNWAGGALPTEAQWEKAARGTDGRRYPWGNFWDASRCASNGADTAPVGSFPSGVSPCGAHDMAGNVWEWCADRFDAQYYKVSPAQNPEGPVNGKYRVVRGGSWRYLDIDSFRCARRGRCTQVGRGRDGGFRVVLPVAAP